MSAHRSVVSGKVGVALVTLVGALATRATVAAADVTVSPDPTGPGYAKLQRLANWLAQYGLLAALVSVLVGAGGWGMFTAFGGGMHASRAKVCMLGGLGGAFVIGIAAALVNGFSKA